MSLIFLLSLSAIAPSIETFISKEGGFSISLPAGASEKQVAPNVRLARGSVEGEGIVYEYTVISSALGQTAMEPAAFFSAMKAKLQEGFTVTEETDYPYVPSTKNETRGAIAGKSYSIKDSGSVGSVWLLPDFAKQRLYQIFFVVKVTGAKAGSFAPPLSTADYRNSFVLK